MDTKTAIGIITKTGDGGATGACVNKILNGLQEMGIGDLKQAFELFDKNNDGKIDGDELTAVLKSLGLEYDKADVDEMIRRADTNENGVVEYDEFITMMQRFADQPPDVATLDERVQEAFRVFDLDGNGFIDKHELKHVMKRLGETLNDNDLDAMFNEADINGDGQIDFGEFRTLITNCKLK